MLTFRLVKDRFNVANGASINMLSHRLTLAHNERAIQGPLSPIIGLPLTSVPENHY